MGKLWPLVALLAALFLPQGAFADGVNAGLADQNVTPITRAPAAAQTSNVPLVRTDPASGQPIIFGSSQVGRPGIPADQIGGYDVDVAYDHVAVGVAIVAVLFLMTEWMEAR